MSHSAGTSHQATKVERERIIQTAFGAIVEDFGLKSWKIASMCSYTVKEQNATNPNRPSITFSRRFEVSYYAGFEPWVCLWRLIQESLSGQADSEQGQIHTLQKKHLVISFQGDKLDFFLWDYLSQSMPSVRLCCFIKKCDLVLRIHGTKPTERGYDDCGIDSYDAKSGFCTCLRTYFPLTQYYCKDSTLIARMLRE